MAICVLFYYQFYQLGLLQYDEDAQVDHKWLICLERDAFSYNKTC